MGGNKEEFRRKNVMGGAKNLGTPKQPEPMIKIQDHSSNGTRMNKSKSDSEL